MARKLQMVDRSSTEDKKELFVLTHQINTGKVSDYDGQILTPAAWALVTEYDSIDPDTGETIGAKKALVIKLDDGAVIGTISGVFIPQFLDMVDTFGPLTSFSVESGTTKAGRTFIYPMPV